MRKIIISLMLLACLLTACGRPPVFEDAAVTITAQGRSLRVQDNASGAQYRLLRVRANGTGSQVQTLLETENFTIRAGGKLLIIEEPGKTIYLIP